MAGADQRGVAEGGGTLTDLLISIAIFNRSFIVPMRARGATMAKPPAPKSGVTKVRFVMLEAEGPEGDLSQIFSAIQNAVKPTATVVQQRIISSSAPPAMLPESGVDMEASDDFVDRSADDSVETPTTSSKPAKDQKPRSYPKPQVLDADLSAGVPWEDYANARKPDNDKDRFLVAAAWWTEHGGEEAIGISHVYTLYKKMRWPSAIADFAWPLRSLKKDGLLKSGGRGLYIINHIGLGRVEEMERG